MPEFCVADKMHHEQILEVAAMWKRACMQLIMRKRDNKDKTVCRDRSVREIRLRGCHATPKTHVKQRSSDNANPVRLPGILSTGRLAFRAAQQDGSRKCDVLYILAFENSSHCSTVFAC